MVNQDIKDIFISFFGENNVDFTNSDCILIHWDTVTVTNEYDESVDIKDLYCKLLLEPNDSIRFIRFTRSTFTEEQYISRYIHSHVHPLVTPLNGAFQDCCLGRGPLNNTIAKLYSYPNNLNYWRLFCLELSKYVQVESLKGVPYKRMSTIGNYNIAYNTYTYISAGVKAVLMSGPFTEFIHFLLDKNLKFKYDNGYKLAYSDTELALLITSYFEEWVNMNDNNIQFYNRVNSVIMTVAVLKNNDLYLLSERENTIIGDSENNKLLFMFNGEPVRSKIIRSEDSEMKHLTVLSWCIIAHLRVRIQQFINLYYGRNVEEKYEIVYVDC